MQQSPKIRTMAEAFLVIESLTERVHELEREVQELSKKEK